jgi:hypothetical protein
LWRQSLMNTKEKGGWTAMSLFAAFAGVEASLVFAN